MQLGPNKQRSGTQLYSIQLFIMENEIKFCEKCKDEFFANNNLLSVKKK